MLTLDSQLTFENEHGTMQQRNHHTRFDRLLTLVWMAVACTCSLYAQDPVRTVEMNLYNSGQYVIQRAPSGLAANWSLIWPSTAGTSGSLLLSSVAGTTSTLSWVSPGSDGQILTVVGGVPSWTAPTLNWLLTGNSDAVATSFLGPTTASVPLNLATSNATPGDINFYLGTVGASNLHMSLSPTTGLEIGNATNSVNTTIAALGGVANATLPVGFDRVVIANNAGLLNEASYAAVASEVAWVLVGNANATSTNFLGPTGASVPLNLATANATAGDVNFYLGVVAPGNLRMNLSTASGLAIGNATNSVNTAVTGTLSSTGNTTLASTAGSTVTLTNTTGSLTVNGTVGTPNITFTEVGGIAKATVPVGFDRVLVSNGAGLVDQASYAAVASEVAWVLIGNANATSTSFLGPTSANVPLNLATANASAGDMNFYLGTVAPANLRMNLSTASGLAIGNATNSVNTAITGSLLVNGTAGTPNVTFASLGGVAKATLPVGYDRVVISNATGLLDESTYDAVVGGVGWLLTGNANATGANFIGPTSASVPMNIATANATAGDINFYLGTVAAANLRMNLSTASGLAIGNATNSVNTAVTGTLSSTGNTTLATTAGSTVTLTNATGSLTVNGTALTPNVTMASLSGVAKATIPVGFDRVVVSNATGQLDQTTYAAVVGDVAWVLVGNPNALATSFLGPTTASIPLNLATANATAGDINFYLGTVSPANLRMTLSTASGLAIGNATNSVNTAVTGTLSCTGNTTLASIAGSTVTLTNATGSLTVNGTALTPNVTMTSLGGVAKATLPVGYDRVVISNATGLLDESTYDAVVGGVGWLLAGNSNATATSFIGPTTASIPMNIATANATAGDINFYLGTVAAPNLRMNLSTASGLAIGNATNSVNTAVTGTLSSTGNTTLASTAGSNVTLTNATGSLTVNGTALTPNVTMTSLSGVAKATIPVGFDRVVVANVTGQLDQTSYAAVVGSVAWVLAGNATTTAWNGTTGSFLGTTSTQPLSIATTNATAQDIRFYTGASGANERMRINATGEIGIGTTSAAGQLLTVNGTAGTPNVTITELGGVAKATLPVGYDRVVISNATGQLDEASYAAVVGDVAWVLVGNANAGATNFLGPTSASVPLNLATANATAGDINFYLGAVAAANLRMNLSTASGLAIGNATNSVNTAVTGTLSSTGNTTLASTAGSTVTLTNATGSLTVNGTALTPNVTMTSLGGVAKATIPVGYDRIVVSNATGQLDQTTYAAVVGSVAWVLAGNATTTAWNGTTGSFLGTTSTQPLSIATTNATAQDIRFYTGASGANERMRINATGEIGIGTTSAVGQLLTVNGTAGTPNVTIMELGGVAKATLPVGYDRVVLSNATGQLDEATYAAVVGNVAWVLTGNSNAIASSFLGPTTASVPMNIATANATAGDINFYLGVVAPGNLRMNLSTASGLAIGNATNSVNTAVTGTLSSTGNATLASTAGSTVTLTNATGSLTVNGTALTPNVTMTSLGGVAKATIPVGYDRVVVSNATGQLDQTTYAAVVGSVAWVLAGNATTSAWNGAAGSFLGTTSTQPLSIATTNATAQDIRFYTGASGANERMRINATGEIGIGTTSAVGQLLTVNGTAGTPNVTITELGGVAKATLPVGYDRVVLSNATGQLDEATYAAVVGGVGWLLAGNSNATATSFIGPTTASIPMNIATANATPGPINFYIGTVAAANLRMTLTNTQHTIGDATNNVATIMTGTLSATGTTTLASTAGSTVTLTNATGSLTVNGTALTPNVTMTSLGGVAKATIPVGYDRVVVSNATGQLDQTTYSAVVGSVAWVLAGNTPPAAWNGTTGALLGTTNTIPLVIATTNTSTAQPIQFWTNNLERMRVASTGEVGVGTTTPTTNARLHTVGAATSAATTAYGLLSEVQAVATSTGIGAYVRTTGATGSLHPLVASSQNNAAVYLGSTAADIPASLTTLLAGTSNLNSTYMFNARVSGGLTMVGTTSGTVTLQAPAVIGTNHTYTMPAATGAANQVLRVASTPAPTAAAATLEWATAATAPVFARRTSDQAYAATGLANDAQLAVALTANDVFEFEAMIAYSGVTSAAAMRLAFTVPAGASIRWGIVNGGFASVSPMSVSVSGTAISDIPVNTTTPTNEQVIYVKGLVVMSATAGNLQLQAATTTASTTVNLLTNSFIKATKVN